MKSLLCHRLLPICSPGGMIGQSRCALSGSSDIDLFRYGKGVITSMPM
jgi:hypothetical protein